MDAHQDVLGVCHVSDHEGHVLLAVKDRLVDHGIEVSSRSRDDRLGNLEHELLVSSSIADEVGDRDHRHVVPGGECLELLEPSHARLVLGHHLAQDAGGGEPRQTRQVHRGFGVAGALEHAARAVAQRKDVTRSIQVRRTRRGVDERLDRRCPV